MEPLFEIGDLVSRRILKISPIFGNPPVVTFHTKKPELDYLALGIVIEDKHKDDYDSYIMLDECLIRPYHGRVKVKWYNHIPSAQWYYPDQIEKIG